MREKGPVKLMFVPSLRFLPARQSPDAVSIKFIDGDLSDTEAILNLLTQRKTS